MDRATGLHRNRWGRSGLGWNCGRLVVRLGADSEGRQQCQLTTYVRLGAVYNSGSFKMSTWIPFVWSLINVLILIVSSFSIQGGL